MSTPVLDAIRTFLDSHGIEYRILHHEPTRTSEESAQIRGEELKVGAKAILMKCDSSFRLFVISAAQKIDSKAIKSALKLKSLRFATTEELLGLTGLEPGAVPPFGRPILDFDLYADPSVFENERVAFNAGSLTDSIILSANEYQRVAGANEMKFALQM
jgi:prolyl-tRNA editing enzyme YbaK/EbsC (Cys-tRNA(Pro) deacylase)